MAVQIARTQSAADRKWGYEFACDGLMSKDEAMSHLGGISRRTLGRLMAERVIRSGKLTGKVVLCRRSVVEYAKSRES